MNAPANITPAAQVPVKPVWSGVEATDYGPYFEAKLARLAHLIWTNPALKAEFMAGPKDVLAREADFHFPPEVSVKVIEEGEGGFEHFVVPVTPPQSEFYYRFEQIAGWWMHAHQLTWWLSRLENGQEAFKMLDALQIMIIGHIWQNPAFRQRMLEDPKAALESDSGAVFPPMKSWEDTPTQAHLVLPKAPWEHKIEGKFDVMGKWFLLGHTFWWWLLTARLYAPVRPTVGGLVA